MSLLPTLYTNAFSDPDDGDQEFGAVEGIDHPIGAGAEPPQPLPRNDQSRVFDAAPDADLDTLPQTTSLQRAVIGHMKQGGHWRGTGGVIIPDDHLRWGDQTYRHKFTLFDG